MLELFSGLDLRLVLTLILSLGFVLTFEFINGFHDTANAVATVIYTQSMKPRLAVLASGLCNFLGVLSGGLAVAYAIVHLLPVDLLVSVNTAHGMHDKRMTTSIRHQIDEVAQVVIMFNLINTNTMLHTNIDTHRIAHCLDTIGHQLRLGH